MARMDSLIGVKGDMIVVGYGDGGNSETLGAKRDFLLCCRAVDADKSDSECRRTMPWAMLIMLIARDVAMIKRSALRVGFTG